MKIEKAITRGWAQHDQAFREAERAGRIFFEVRPKRTYATIHFDTISADPSVCRCLTEEGTRQIKEIYDEYCVSLIGKGRPKTVYVAFGPTVGFLTVRKEDTDHLADKVMAILSNERYHKKEV